VTQDDLLYLWDARESVVGMSCEFARESPGRNDRAMTLRLLYLMFRQVLRSSEEGDT
jgi:hypothetical protein